MKASKSFRKYLFSAGILLLFFTEASAQFIRKDPNQPDRPITEKQQTPIIQNLLKTLEAQYVFPDVAKKMAADINRRVKKGEYSRLTSSKAFADSLTRHLRFISHDKHLSLDYVYQNLPDLSKLPAKPSPEVLKQMWKLGSQRNFGFTKLEILEGNIGYLNLEVFPSPAEAAETASAAMNLLANTEALIIDLRQNRGGTPEMVEYFASYFFSDLQPIHLNTIYNRIDDSSKQFWSYQALAGKRYLNKEVYILTSNNTFSAGEGFAYSLQAQKRATVVGEVAGGGAHPSRAARLDDHFLLIVPFARSINPVTKSNWEGTGVIPDIKVAAKDALETAHKKALEKVKTATANTDVMTSPPNQVVPKPGADMIQRKMGVPNPEKLQKEKVN